MATRTQLIALFARAVRDKRFRLRLRKDPGRAAASMGIKLTAKQTKAIKTGVRHVDQWVRKAVARVFIIPPFKKRPRRSKARSRRK